MVCSVRRCKLYSEEKNFKKILKRRKEKRKIKKVAAAAAVGVKEQKAHNRILCG